MFLYVTEMLRYGDREKHSYVLGVFSSEEKAEYAGDVEKSWRACKYEPRVTKLELDTVDNWSDKVLHHLRCVDK